LLSREAVRFGGWPLRMSALVVIRLAVTTVALARRARLWNILNTEQVCGANSIVRWMHWRGHCWRAPPARFGARTGNHSGRSSGCGLSMLAPHRRMATRSLSA